MIFNIRYYIQADKAEDLINEASNSLTLQTETIKELKVDRKELIEEYNEKIDKCNEKWKDLVFKNDEDCKDMLFENDKNWRWVFDGLEEDYEDAIDIYEEALRDC